MAAVVGPQRVSAAVRPKQDRQSEAGIGRAPPMTADAALAPWAVSLGQRAGGVVTGDGSPIRPFGTAEGATRLTDVAPSSALASGWARHPAARGRPLGERRRARCPLRRPNRTRRQRPHFATTVDRPVRHSSVSPSVKGATPHRHGPFRSRSTQPGVLRQPAADHTSLTRPASAYGDLLTHHPAH